MKNFHNQKTRFTKSQIAAVLEEGGSGISIAEASRERILIVPTHYSGKGEYVGVTVPALNRVK
jgi:putative transposase